MKWLIPARQEQLIRFLRLQSWVGKVVLLVPLRGTGHSLTRDSAWGSGVRDRLCRETCFMQHGLGARENSCLCVSIIPVRCSQLISKAMCLLRPCTHSILALFLIAASLLNVPND